MNNGLIAVRYATALLGYANKDKSDDSVYLQMKNIARSYLQFDELRLTLDNPVLANLAKKKIIYLAAGGDVTESTKRFFDLLLDNKREIHLHAIALKYIELYRQQKNIHYGKLTTASLIDTNIEKRLISLMEKQTGGLVELDKTVDASILGGFMLEVDFIRWDASLSGQLQRIKNEYIEKNKRIM